MRQRVGKIARLPHALREELNRRLRDGEPGPSVLAWVNALPETVKVLAEQFEGEAINEENLRKWRVGGYVEWRDRHDRLDHTRELASMAANLARANGGTIAEGAMAIASGQVLEILEASDGTIEPAQLGELINNMTALRAQEIAAERVKLETEKLKRKDEELLLDRQRFQRQTCELFLKWRDDDRAKTIADSGASNAEKIEQLGAAMFGDLWK